MSRIERFDEAEPTLEYNPPAEVRASMLYNVLPALVTNRLPTIPSFRQSLGGKKHVRSTSLAEMSVPGTPPPDYTSRPSSGYVTPLRLSNDVEGEFSDAVSEQAPSSPDTYSNLPETKTGINWRYASLGTNLLNQAYRESSSLAQDPNETSPALGRQMYIHGLTYLLRGLPSDLSSEETLSIQAALPQSVANVQVQSNTHTLVLPESYLQSQNRVREEPTALHRFTAALVFQMFVLFQFLMPYIKLLLAYSYQFERKHQITKRIFSTSVATVDELGRRSVRLSHTICQMNDGKVGQAINEMTIWWVKGVTGGLQQGIEQGLVSMQATDNRRRRVSGTKDDKI